MTGTKKIASFGKNGIAPRAVHEVLAPSAILFAPSVVQFQTTCQKPAHDRHRSIINTIVVLTFCRKGLEGNILWRT